MPEDTFHFQSGAEIDTRPKNEVLKDFKFKEIVASAASVNWTEKPEASWRKFPDQQQDGSGSCVAQTTKKLAGILLWLRTGIYVPFSATHIYQERSTKPSSGMIGVEAFEAWRTKGITLESLVPSENMNDAQMDAFKISEFDRLVGEVSKIKNHIGADNGDFETVASVIQQTGKGVMTWFYFTPEEWARKEPVLINMQLDLYATSTARHSVAAIDYFLVNGKKYILIEDSAHFGGITRRAISEEFFKARNFFARYPMNFVFAEPAPKEVLPPNPITPPTPKFSYNFTKVLEFGMTDGDVVALQDVLKAEGFFPLNGTSTGYYGAITAKGVFKWQTKYAVAPQAELDSLQGRKVGLKTLAKLNEIYGG